MELFGEEGYALVHFVNQAGKTYAAWTLYTVMCLIIKAVWVFDTIYVTFFYFYFLCLSLSGFFFF